MKIAMIPARMGSQRLKQKNLRELGGIPLITRAIRKCREAGVFDEIWVNSEHPAFGEIARTEGASFHQRPENLGGNQATSEQYIQDFLEARPCRWLVQVHSIAPLLTVDQIRGFVGELGKGMVDVLLGVVPEQIECLHDGKPVNFKFSEKTNSQDLKPVMRVSWSMTGWLSETYRKAAKEGKCATYAGRVGVYELDRLAGLVIKTEEDLQMAEALLPLREK